MATWGSYLVDNLEDKRDWSDPVITSILVQLFFIRGYEYGIMDSQIPFLLMGIVSIMFKTFHQLYRENHKTFEFFNLTCSHIWIFMEFYYCNRVYNFYGIFELNLLMILVHIILSELFTKQGQKLNDRYIVIWNLLNALKYYEVVKIIA